MHIGVLVGITAVEDLLCAVVLHPDGDFKVAHFLDVCSRHVLREFQMLKFARNEVNRCAFRIRQHLHENMMEHSFAVASHIAVGFLLVHRDVDTSIGVNVRHNVGQYRNGVAFNRERAFDIHKGCDFCMLVELVLYVVEFQRL